MPLPASSPESLLESYKQSYGDMLKHLQGFHKNQDIEEDDGTESKEKQNDENNSSVLNLSQTHSEHPDDQGLHKNQDIEKDDGSESKENHDEEKNSSVLNLSHS